MKQGNTHKIRIERLLRSNEFILLAAYIAIFVILGVSNAGFFSAGNQMTIVKSLSFYGIIAAGMTWVMINGDIDIALGAESAFGSVFSTWLMLRTHCFGMMDSTSEGAGVFLCVLVTMAVAAALHSAACKSQNSEGGNFSLH